MLEVQFLLNTMMLIILRTVHTEVIDIYLTQDDLTNNGFKYGFNPIAVAKEHGKKAAKIMDVEVEFIEQMLYKIEERTGQKPFYF